MIATLCLGLGLVFVIEGLLWAAAPSAVERMLEALRAMPEAARRQIGLLGVVTGLILIWIAEAIAG